MVFPNIEKIKQEYTDKFVVVDARRPELARFADVVGQVKTVNMSGRALVEFLDYHLNTGWFDIELEFLKLVDKPQPKPKEEKKAAAPKAEAKTEAKAKPPVAAATSPAGKPSTADILAKLKGGGGAAPAAPAEKKEASPKVAAPPAGGKADRAKMSVADMIAAAKGGAAAAPKEEAAAPVQEAPAPGPSVPEPEPSAKASPKTGAPSAEAGSPGIVKIDKSGMSVDQMVTYCREKDAS